MSWGGCLDSHRPQSRRLGALPSPSVQVTRTPSQILAAPPHASCILAFSACSSCRHCAVVRLVSRQFAAGRPRLGRSACSAGRRLHSCLKIFAASVHDYFLRAFRCVFEACALRNLKICARTPQVFNQGVVVRYLEMSPMTSGTILVYRMWLL